MAFGESFMQGEQGYVMVIFRSGEIKAKDNRCALEHVRHAFRRIKIIPLASDGRGWGHKPHLSITL